MIPAVEADAEAVWLEQPGDLGEGGLHPAAVHVAGDVAAVAVAVVDQVGRVGHDQVHTGRGHLAHHLDAVAVDDAVDEGVDGAHRERVR
ncbi:MAG: hypothetical protein Q8R28_04665 [Dehalococcoidia bacterium]|nr:hypothetical protein [Dehalococcoidia bacterium]